MALLATKTATVPIVKSRFLKYFITTSIKLNFPDNNCYTPFVKYFKIFFLSRQE